MPERLYDIDIKRETCTLNRLALKSDPGGINLTHSSTLTAFGCMTYTRHDEPAKMEPSALPANVEAVHLQERRAYAPMIELDEDRLASLPTMPTAMIGVESGDGVADAVAANEHADALPGRRGGVGHREQAAAAANPYRSLTLLLARSNAPAALESGD